MTLLRQQRAASAGSGRLRGRRSRRSRRSARLESVLYLFGRFLVSAVSGKGRPRRRNVAERLAGFPRSLPVQSDVTIRWNDRQMPFIEAASDRDLAVALGAVHAHLRLSQIEIMRWIAQGRISEVIGPAGVEADHALRLIDVGRAAADIEAAMPPETRAWLSGFADGLNACIEQTRERPYELALLGVEPAPWTCSDLIALSRVAAVDFTWKVWLRLMHLRNRPDWLRLWQRLVGRDALPVPSFAGSDSVFTPEWFLGGFDRSGSNSLAVCGERSATGAALIASDPHLQVSLPNVWLLAGYRSPSYHAVGLMIPGVPAIALGRNPWIAWGGTSLHAASSDLFDVSDVPEADMRIRRERIGVRRGRDVEVDLRESPYGPVISDATILGAGRGAPMALRWIGHRPTDELTALLKVNRARGWDDFVDALDGFAIPAQNMIYADREGHIGQAMAAQVPRRPMGVPADMVLPTTEHAHWDRIVTARGLPHKLDPDAGFVASANDAPSATEIPVGFFFSPDERVVRMRTLLSAAERLTATDLRAIQNDVVVPSATGLRDKLLTALAAEGEASRIDDDALLAALRAWDGAYTAESAGALAFELLSFHLVEKLHGHDDAQLYAATWDAWSLLREDVETTDPQRLRLAARESLDAAQSAFGRLRTWGRAHRLRMMHPFGRLPIAGRWFRYGDQPASGGNETLLKTAFGFAGGEHSVRFGANARHISDLSDMDENYFVLLGGQDGWLGSTTFADQLSLWNRKEMIRVPLRPESAREAFPNAMTITPARTAETVDA